jgi:ISXO2-like transposase domain
VVEADETIIRFRTKNDPVVVPAGRSGVGKMLVAGAVEIDGSKPRRARLKVIEGFGKPELHAFVLDAVAPQTQLVTDDWPSDRDLPRPTQRDHARPDGGAYRAAVDPSAVFKPQAPGPGRLPRTSAGFSLAQSLIDDLSAAPLRLCADADANASAGNSRHRRFLDLDTYNSAPGDAPQGFSH